MEEINFTFNVASLVRSALKIYIEKHNCTEGDQAKRMASIDVIYNLLKDNEIESIVKEWSNKNDGKKTIFEDGTLENDAKQMWEIIWTHEAYKKSLNTHILRGYSGHGVFDKKTEEFYPCQLMEHYDTIKKIIKTNYPDLWEVHKNFVNGSIKKASEIDQFILNDLVLVGKQKHDTYYTVSEREY